MYRENIYEVIEAIGQPISTIVIPKNTGLKGYAWKVLKEAGVDLDRAVEVERDKLKFCDLRILIRRGEDIAQVVEDEFRMGNVVLGVTGDDLFDEYRLRNPNNRLKIENTYDWYDPEARFLRPALCLINQNGSPSSISPWADIAINGKYEYTARLYLKKSRILPMGSGDRREYSIKILWGGLEDDVASGKYNCCIDTVYTGETIRKKRLEVADIIRFSDLVVISALRSEKPGLVEVMGNALIENKRGA